MGHSLAALADAVEREALQINPADAPAARFDPLNGVE